MSTDMQEKPTVKIKGWQLVYGRLYGQVYGHPRFRDGSSVVTSVVVEAPDEPKKGDKVITKNTIYILDDEELKQWHE